MRRERYYLLDLPKAAITALDAIQYYACVVEGICQNDSEFDHNGKLAEHVRECRAIAERIKGWGLDPTLHGIIKAAE